MKSGGMRSGTAFHVGNTGSNPVGDATNNINGLGEILSHFIFP
jgi:hypothetical protein